MNPTPDTLRAKWAVGIDEDNPQYAFIGVEGASICWVENDDADAFRKIVDAHNATLDAWEVDRQRLEAAVAGINTLSFCPLCDREIGQGAKHLAGCVAALAAGEKKPDDHDRDWTPTDEGDK